METLASIGLEEDESLITCPECDGNYCVKLEVKGFAPYIELTCLECGYVTETLKVSLETHELKILNMMRKDKGLGDITEFKKKKYCSYRDGRRVENKMS